MFKIFIFIFFIRMYYSFVDDCGFVGSFSPTMNSGSYLIGNYSVSGAE